MEQGPEDASDGAAESEEQAGQTGGAGKSERRATTGPDNYATERPDGPSSADVQGTGKSSRSSGPGGSLSTTSATPNGSCSDLCPGAGAGQQHCDNPDPQDGSSGGSSIDDSGAGGPAGPSDGAGQQRSGEDNARERAEDDANAGASDDGRDVAGNATASLFSLTGVEGFDLGQGGNVENGEVPAEAPSPNVPGHTAVKMELPAGGKRSEVRPKDVAQDIKAGQNMFFGYSAFLPEDFPTDASDFQVIWQLHSESRTSSPPLALEVQQGKLWLANVGELVEDLGPVNAGENVTVQMGIDFEVGEGSVTVWRDGEEILSDFQPPRGTMIDNLNYLQTGLYRREDGSPASSLFLNDMKVGDTLESVSGLAGGPTAIQESGVAGALGSTTGALLGGLLPVAGMRWRRRRSLW